MSATLRLGFAGTPDFAATQLQALITSAQKPELVLTQPDRPTGRGRKLKPSPVKALAESSGLLVLDPASLKNTDPASLGLDNLDLLIVAAYGLILPPRILTAPRLGCLNVHASLLPRWRGAAPVERAIIAGDQETGVCLMQMDAGLDTGPVFTCERTPINPDETGGMLEARLATAGARLLVRTLPELASMTPTPQPAAGVTYAHKLSPKDSKLSWSDPPDAICRRIRALADRAPVTLFSADGTRIRLLAAAPASDAGPKPSTTAGAIMESGRDGIQVACEKGSLRLTRLQLNRGKGRPMDASAAANGYPDLFGVGHLLLSQPTP